MAGRRYPADCANTNRTDVDLILRVAMKITNGNKVESHA